jgi:hypothetical protein
LEQLTARRFISLSGKRMKLLRFGNPGSERPGVLDNDGRLRDLSQYITICAATRCCRRVWRVCASWISTACRWLKAIRVLAPALAVSVNLSASV